jgi:NAD(P)-dependent dehydrogenase (short-subunit alcohol dehydrogenase family)
MKRLEGKVAVITGGNSGIGLATAQVFRDEGARVAIAGRSPKTLEQAAKALGSGSLAVQADVSKLPDIDKLFTQVTKKFGKIDILFVNAGIAKFVPVPDATEQHFNEIFDTNVKGAYFTIQRAIPHLNEGASIILNASVADSVGVPGSSVYSASKAALRSFARTVAAELVDRRIRVNVVSPGPIATPIQGRMGLPPEAVDEVMRGLIAKVPMKRIGQADEVARTVLFFATPDSSFITGSELYVDGGMRQL